MGEHSAGYNPPMTEAQAADLIATMKVIAGTLAAMEKLQIKEAVFLEDIRNQLGKLNGQ